MTRPSTGRLSPPPPPPPLGQLGHPAGRCPCRGSSWPRSSHQASSTLRRCRGQQRQRHCRGRALHLPLGLRRPSARPRRRSCLFVPPPSLGAALRGGRSLDFTGGKRRGCGCGVRRQKQPQGNKGQKRVSARAGCAAPPRSGPSRGSACARGHTSARAGGIRAHTSACAGQDKSTTKEAKGSRRARGAGRWRAGRARGAGA